MSGPEGFPAPATDLRLAPPDPAIPPRNSVCLRSNVLVAAYRTSSCSCRSCTGLARGSTLCSRTRPTPSAIYNVVCRRRSVTMTRITLHYDVVSPWSVFAYHILKRYRQAWNYELVLKPMFLGGVMKESGNQPPLTVKNKGAWMNKVDLPLFAEMCDIPYTFPETFPLLTIQPMRFLRAIEKLYPERLERATDLYWDLIWKRESGQLAKDAIDPTKYPQKFSDAGILTEEQVGKVVEAANSTEIKESLKTEATDLVTKGGAFGFPWIVVEKPGSAPRSFFGADRFEHIAYWLGQSWDGPRGPGTRASLARPSATQSKL